MVTGLRGLRSRLLEIREYLQVCVCACVCVVVVGLAVLCGWVIEWGGGWGAGTARYGAQTLAAGAGGKQARGAAPCSRLFGCCCGRHHQQAGGAPEVAVGCREGVPAPGCKTPRHGVLLQAAE